MKIQDLEKFTKEEIGNILVELVDRMERKGNQSMDYFNHLKDADKEINNKAHQHYSALLIEVDNIESIIKIKTK